MRTKHSSNNSRKPIRDWESEDEYRREVATGSCMGLLITLMMTLSWCIWGMWMQ